MDLIARWGDVAALLLLAAVFAGFIGERFPPSVVAAAGAAAFLALGLVSSDDALSAFSNPAPITIAALFILSGALVRTGAVDAVATQILKVAGARPRLAVAGLFAGAMASSGFINNTPVVIILIPVTIRLAARIGVSPKKLLMPLSYAAILGGTLTLIGTSTNLIVDGLARQSGLAGFGIFDVTLVGLAAAAAGTVTMLLLGRFLLPRADKEESISADVADPVMLSELRVKPEAGVLGAPIRQIPALRPSGIKLISVRRGGVALNLKEEHFLEERDVLIIRGAEAEILTLAENKDFDIGMPGRSPIGENISLATVSIAANHPTIGARLAEAPFVSRFPIGVIAASRHGNPAGPDLSSLTLKPGDRLLIRAGRTTLRDLQEHRFLVYGGAPLGRAFRRRKVAIAVAAIASVVVLASFGAMPIAALALIAASAILILRCVDADEAWRSIDGEVLVLIFSMLIIGHGLQSAGSIDLVAGLISPMLKAASPFFLIFGVYLLAWLMTELVTNSAVAVILTPFVITLAQELGVDPRPLLVACMFGASASFSTPIGYQTNTLVYAAGGYRFTDFLKMGVPMNLFVGLASAAAINAIF